MGKNWMYWILVYIVCLTIFYYSSLSYPMAASGLAGLAGWIFHVFEYGVLSVAAYLAFRNDNKFANKRLSTLLFVLLYAVSDEIHQYFVPGRQASMMDFGFDAIGSLAVLLFTL